MLSARPARVVRRARCHQRRRSQKLRSRHHPRKLGWALEYDSTQRLAPSTPSTHAARASRSHLVRPPPPDGHPKNCPPNRLPTVLLTGVYRTPEYHRSTTRYTHVRRIPYSYDEGRRGGHSQAHAPAPRPRRAGAPPPAPRPASWLAPTHELSPRTHVIARSLRVTQLHSGHDGRVPASWVWRWRLGQCLHCC
eukprot:COSAG03_NODE_10965_length_618_cov_204.533719_1_plen_193_part_10